MEERHKRRLFDFDSVSVSLVITAMPINITDGLVLSETFLSVRQDEPAVNFVRGLGGEILISDNLDTVAMLELVYVPSSKNVIDLDRAFKSGVSFGMVIQNISSPKYYGVATNCRIINKPDLDIGINGYGNSRWKIIMADYVETYLKV